MKFDESPIEIWMRQSDTTFKVHFVWSPSSLTKMRIDYLLNHHFIPWRYLHVFNKFELQKHNLFFIILMVKYML